MVQQNLTNKFESKMKDYDFLITPSTASVAPKIGESEKTDTSLIWTFFGAPAISLPMFYDDKKNYLLDCKLSHQDIMIFFF